MPGQQNDGDRVSSEALGRPLMGACVFNLAGNQRVVRDNPIFGQTRHMFGIARPFEPFVIAGKDAAPDWA